MAEPNGKLTPDEVASLAAKFKLLANETRLKLIYALLLNDDVSVSELVKQVSLPTTAVSNQLRLLEANDVLRCRRAGKRMLYRLVDHNCSKLLNLAIEGHRQVGN